MLMKNTTYQITLTLVCLAFFGTMNSSVVVAQTFNSSNLPIVVINTNGQTIVDDPKITADMGIIYNGEGIRNNFTDSLNHYNGKIGIEIRGSSSQMFPKKQYGFETRNTLGSSIDVPLLGFPEESDWILSAQYNDKTLMRDVITYSLSNSMGRYASRTRYCEVVINGEYRGVYMLFEKIKRDKNRVNISKLDSTGITGDALTGGYIFKIDKLDITGNEGWYSTFAPFTGAKQKILYQYTFPKPEDITEAQKTYIKNYMLNFEANMMMPAYDDTVNGYAKILDVSSAVDYFLINELTKNVDGFRLSFYMYKDKDSKNGKLFLGPYWDYNHGFGNSDYYDGAIIEGWQLSYLTTNSTFKTTDQFQPPFWWNRLLQDKNFMNKVKLRWIELRKKQFVVKSIEAFIDSFVVHLAEAQQRNFVKWPILNTYVWPNAYVGGSYFNEITYLKKWINDRINWIDIELTGSPLSVLGNNSLVPTEFALAQNYPNPFNPSTIIEYELPEKNIVTCTLFDMLGKKVASLVNCEQNPGHYHLQFSSNDFQLSSGIYFYQLRVGTYTAQRKMVLLK
jgi:hypothetical protein